MAREWAMALYWRLPVAIQELALSLYAARLDDWYYGGEFEQRCNEVRRSSWKSVADIENWQLGQLKQVFRSAVDHVPRYRSAFGCLDVDGFRSLRDLRSLPLLEKQSIRQKEAELLDERLRRRQLFRRATSGSTGTSLTIFWPKGALQRFYAIFEVRVQNAAGVSRHLPRAMLGGRPILRGDVTEPPFWRWNSRWKQLYLSSYHVSSATARSYVEALRHSPVQWLTGYGSAIAALAESALAAGVEPQPMKAVIVSGDTLQAGMRTSIEAFFRCKCYDSYGQAEGVAMAMECERGRLHLVPEVGIVEILDEDGQPCEPGAVGEIVATGLVNDGMPLLRYRSGDYASWSREQACPCGLVHPIIEALEGRVDDYLVTADGRRIGRLSTAMKRSPAIHSAQLVQDRPGHAFLLIRPGDGYRAADAKPVVDDIRERIGDFDLDVIEVTEIPRTKRGKTRLVVQLQNHPELASDYRRSLRIG